MSDKGRDVDLTRAKQNTGVWLVKVSFNLNEELSVVEHSGEKTTSVRAPREHPFTMQTVGGQTLAVFTESSSVVLNACATEVSVKCDMLGNSKASLPITGLEVKFLDTRSRI
ncbi:General transcription factor IIF subunit 2 [Bagarius yarrelli]|uniref:General transcription factor IIF subunit 2 n=1 Tax=Bagarius yarrelli TaxID=175774 RepID=A0A556U4U4_BAGYA|nr:General transcription factor IIF subunit 2 [Bagarius yarrelli]